MTELNIWARIVLVVAGVAQMAHLVLILATPAAVFHSAASQDVRFVLNGVALCGSLTAAASVHRQRRKARKPEA